MTPSAAAEPAPPPAPLISPISPGGDNYSGYAAVAPSFKVLSAQWKMPTLTCPPFGDLGGAVNGVVNSVLTGGSVFRVPGLLAHPGAALGTLMIPHFGPWIGLVGMGPGGDRTLIQTGTIGECDAGVPHYFGFFETPSFSNQEGMPTPDADTPDNRWNTPPTIPGDEVAATITWDGRTNYHLAVADTTQGWHYGATFQSPVIPTAALAVVEGIPYNVPGFTSVTFTGVTADGRPLATYNPQSLSIAAPHISPTPITDDSFTIPSP
ncbi:G1 family glutamic endopeptidase [Nocardia sp.]|uniref:G1 family glutamic endopeptidase n=1 Tax=Nocardia sp. TaxID=1821 RepID=UPI0026218C84|nr:G1 family glutamic endopeptidase [Nocardia sp.]